MSEPRESCIPIRSESDLVIARKVVRATAVELGFGVTDVTRIVTAASELTRNVLRYANEGVVRTRPLNIGGQVGIEIVFADQGPGIADVEMAMQEGYSTGKGLGLGLPGSRRLMDEMQIQSELGTGTTITIRKWVRRPGS